MSPFDRREVDDITPLFDDTHDSRMARNRTLAPRGPKSIVIQKAGDGIDVTVTDWPHESIDVAGSGSFQFLIFRAEDVDQTTAAGISSGFARATLLSPAIPAPGPTSSAIQHYPFTDGYFYVLGADTDGNRSAPIGPIKITSGTGGAIPKDVEHFQASESGELRDGALVSVVSYSFRVPTEGGAVDRVQFMFLNYPTLNEFSEGQSVRVTVGRGATQIGELVFPRGLRTGNGSISIAGTAVTGAGTEFLTLAAAAGGDQLEVFGKLARIASVPSNTSMTLAGGWTGPAVAAVDDWMVIGAVTIYAVSEGVNGVRRDDPENTTAVALVDLDGNLSAPIAPGTVYVSNLDNAVRIEADQVAGTQLTEYVLYRSTGSGVDGGMALSPPQPSAGTVLQQTQSITNRPVAGSLVQFNDTDFTATQKEAGQAFVWYVTVRAANLESAAASAVGTCRLTSSQDVDPSITGRVGLKNLLFDAFIGGTSGNTVVDSDTSQDAFNGTSVGNLPGKPYGGSGVTVGTGKFIGYTRWHSVTDGAASVCKFINGNEVQFPAPGSSKTTILYEEIDAWSLGLGGAQGVKITKGGLYVLSGVFRYDTTQPTGTFYLWIDQMNNNVVSGQALRRYRDPADQALKFYTQGSASNKYAVACSDTTSTWQRFYAVFQLDSSLTTKQVRPQFSLYNTTVGDLRLKWAMLNEGEDLGYWTGDMGDTTVAQPIGGGPDPHSGDGPGGRGGPYPT